MLRSKGKAFHPGNKVTQKPGKGPMLEYSSHVAGNYRGQCSWVVAERHSYEVGEIDGPGSGGGGE